MDCFLVVHDVEVEEGLELVNVELYICHEQPIDLKIGACIEEEH